MKGIVSLMGKPQALNGFEESSIYSVEDPKWFVASRIIQKKAEGAVVIWDFDGVILDSEPWQGESYRVLLQERGFTPADDFFNEMVGHHEKVIWKKLIELGHTVQDPIEALVEERREVVRRLLKENVQPSWVVQALIPLFADVAVEQTIVSAGNPDLIIDLLQYWGLDKELTFLPAPGRKLERLSQLWAKSPTVQIEDNGKYLTEAIKAGSYGIAVRHSLSPKVLPDVEFVLHL